MTKILLNKLEEITPNAHPIYRAGFECANAVLVLFGILNNGRRASHYLAQILHESGGLRVHTENMNYTTAERIRSVWPSRFPTLESARPFVRNPEGLAAKVYDGRMGNDKPGDGWRYRGRGPIQLSGKDMYEQVGKALEADFVATPELVLTKEYLIPASAHLWRIKNCNAKADADNLESVTKAINGGYIGLASRRLWLEKARRVVQEIQ